MQRLPYTFEQAKVICASLQHIVGSPFDPELHTTGNIECVAITPFDQINKKKFLLFYVLLEDAKAALEQEYKGLLFDVIVIARGLGNDTEIMYYDVDTWLSKNNLPQDIVHHSSIDDLDDDQVIYN